MLSSERLNLPLLATGQARKEITHNEALQLLDVLVQATCAGGPTNSPPSSPAVGQAFLCGTAPTGAWSDQANCLTIWTSGGWRFVPAFEGLRATDATSGMTWQFKDNAWVAGALLGTKLVIGGEQVVGSRQPSIAEPSGGATIDGEARSAVMKILLAMRRHGLIAG